VGSPPLLLLRKCSSLLCRSPPLLRSTSPSAIGNSLPSLFPSHFTSLSGPLCSLLLLSFPHLSPAHRAKSGYLTSAYIRHVWVQARGRRRVGLRQVPRHEQRI
jgi:hypothetical protein